MNCFSFRAALHKSLTHQPTPPSKLQAQALLHTSFWGTGAAPAWWTRKATLNGYICPPVACMWHQYLGGQLGLTGDLAQCTATFLHVFVTYFSCGSWKGFFFLLPREKPARDFEREAYLGKTTHPQRGGTCSVVSTAQESQLGPTCPPHCVSTGKTWMERPSLFQPAPAAPAPDGRR